MKRSLSLLLVFLLLLSGCFAAQNSSSLCVYRVIAPEYQTTGSLVHAETVYPAETESPLSALLRALQTDSQDARAYNPLSGIRILDCTVADGTATLFLSEEYLHRSGMDKTLCDACCTLTLCALPDIDRLSISVSDEIITQNLTLSDISTDLVGSETGERQVCLYYTDASATHFIPESRFLTLSSSERSERYVIEELLRPSAGVHSPLPQGTELLGVTRKGRSCTINLSAEFLENRPQTAVGELIAVYSLVNSLASLGSIGEVLITVEGESVDRYVYLSLSSPLTPLNFLSDTGNENVSLRLYMSAGGKLFGAPCIPAYGTDPKQALLDELMNAQSFGGYENLFSSDDELHHLNTISGVCRVTLSRSFFERRTGKSASLALDALTLTLLSFDDINSVLVTYPNGEIPRLPDRDLSRPLLQISAEILE